jgi:type IV pilus assembly protein PilW
MPRADGLGMRSRANRRAARGLSIVELMVGVAVGLFIVAAAIALVVNQLNDNRRLMLETQVQQDLRAAADIIGRELRRAGHWPNAARFVWQPDTPFLANPYAASAAGVQVDFSYWRRPTEDGPFGFKWDGNVLKTRLGAGGWQDLTDGNALRITAFAITPRDGPAIRLPCPKLCDDGTEACWPTLTVRDLIVDISGEAVSDPSVRRSLRTEVRLRNDRVDFHIPAGAPTQACPS